MRSALALIVGLLLAAGCSSTTSPDTGGNTSAAGTWVGNVFALGQNTTMTWQLSQSNEAVSGTVTVAQSNGIVLLNGSLTGSLAGSTLTYMITVGPGAIPALPNCTGQLGGTTTISTGSTTTMTGNYTVASSTCPASFPDATFTLTKQ